MEFAGFKITSSSVEPLPKYLEAISNFPKPKNIMDIRAWFGLVNQVANYGRLRRHMTEVRHLLSPKNKFKWTPEIDEAFEWSKQLIVDEIKDGVDIFQPGRPTCLRPDWLKQGIGYFLLQKHCECALPAGALPNCCKSGWRIVLAGSRFLSSAETNYVAIEGEALAVAWGLEQSTSPWVAQHSEWLRTTSRW